MLILIIYVRLYDLLLGFIMILFMVNRICWNRICYLLNLNQGLMICEISFREESNMVKGLNHIRLLGNQFSLGFYRFLCPSNLDFHALWNYLIFWMHKEDHQKFYPFSDLYIKRLIINIKFIKFNNWKMLINQNQSF